MFHNLLGNLWVKAWLAPKHPVRLPKKSNKRGRTLKGAGLCDYAISVVIPLVFCNVMPINEKTANAEGSCACHVEFDFGNLADVTT